MNLYDQLILYFSIFNYLGYFTVCSPQYKLVWIDIP